MGLSRRQERLLTRTGDALARSDPRLASMLAAFRQLAEGEQMPGREQLHSPVSRALTALAGAAAAIGAVIPAGAAACGRWLRRPAGPSGPIPALTGPLKEDTMPATRHPSPLPPDPDTRNRFSPLPPGPGTGNRFSPLPPGPVAVTRSSPLPHGTPPSPGPGQARPETGGPAIPGADLAPAATRQGTAAVGSRSPVTAPPAHASPVVRRLRGRVPASPPRAR